MENKKITVEIPLDLFNKLNEYCHYPNSLDMPKCIKFKTVVKFALEDYLQKRFINSC